MSSHAGPLARVLLHGEETDAALSVTEIVVPPRNPGPPLHRHDFAEAFYVLDGKLVFEVDDVRVVRTGGELCFAPRNSVHTLANHGDAPARYLLVCAPSGFERHWARVAAEAAGVEVPTWAATPVPEVTVVGPPMPMPT
jgi:quercetin dioxygenase-like cupin family protein